MIMRKTIALILAVLMLFSLCACSTTEEADKRIDQLLQQVDSLQIIVNQLNADLTGELAVMTAEDFIWNGQTTAWFLLPSNVSPDMLLVSGALGAMCQANGWTYERKELGPGTGTAQSALIAATAAGNVGAIVYTTLPDYMAPHVQAAADAGIIVLSLDPDTACPAAGAIEIPYERIGREAIETITDWCSDTGTAPEEGSRLPVAVNVFGSRDTEHPLASSRLSAIKETDTLYKFRLGLTPTEDDLFQAAYLWARALMDLMPDLRIFCCDTPDAAYGICYYLEQYAADHALDLTDFCVVWCGENADSETYLSVAREDSAYTAARGYVAWGDDGWTTGSRIGCQLLGIVYGTELPASLEDTYLTLRENHVDQPDIFGGWKWGTNCFSGITVYACFAESEDGVLRRAAMPLSDIINLNAEPEEN